MTPISAVGVLIPHTLLDEPDAVSIIIRPAHLAVAPALSGGRPDVLIRALRASVGSTEATWAQSASVLSTLGEQPLQAAEPATAHVAAAVGQGPDGTPNNSDASAA